MVFTLRLIVLDAGSEDVSRPMHVIWLADAASGKAISLILLEFTMRMLAAVSFCQRHQHGTTPGMARLDRHCIWKMVSQSSPGFTSYLLSPELAQIHRVSRTQACSPTLPLFALSLLLYSTISGERSLFQRHRMAEDNRRRMLIAEF
jgi:hypothetical protein